MSKKVFWTAFIGSDNLGDEAIFSSLLHNLSLKKENVTVASVNPDETTAKTGLHAVNAKGPIALFGAIRRADMVLMGGGGIIQDQSSLLNFLYYGYQLGLAKIFKRPVILCFVGVGPIRSWVSKLILKLTASNIAKAVVRDDKSRRELLPFIDESRIMTVHDPVLNLPVPMESNDRNDDYVLVSLRRWFFSIPMLPASFARKLNKAGIARKRYDHFIGRVAESLDTFLDKHPDVNVRFASFYDSEDLAVIDDVTQLMKHTDRTVAPMPKLTEEEYVSLAKGASFVIGMRFHSLVLAAVAGTPFVALTYSSKVDQFADSVGLTDFTEDVNVYDGPRAAKRFADMYASHAHYRPKLAKEIKKFQQANDRAFRVVSELLK